MPVLVRSEDDVAHVVGVSVGMVSWYNIVILGYQFYRSDKFQEIHLQFCVSNKLNDRNKHLFNLHCNNTNIADERLDK